MGLLEILAQALDKDDANKADALNQAAQNMSPAVISRGLAETFRSDQTPEVGNMVGQMFGQSDGQQQAGMLNAIIKSLGPAATAALAGGVLNTIMDARDKQVSPEQAAQLTPQQVEEVVNQAQASNPGVVDQLADFYANNKGLVNTIGGIAASVMLMKLKDHLTSGNQNN